MKESVRIVRFAVIGTLNALITAGMIALVMYELAPFRLPYDYVAANIIAYVVAQINNFIWSKYWIFPASPHGLQRYSLGRQILLFCLAFTCAYLLQFIFLILMVEIAGMHEYLAQFLGLFVYGAANFIFNKRLTFR